MRLTKQVIILIILFAFVSAQNNASPKNTLNKKEYVYVLQGLGQGK
jgi:hypothetical protein